MTQENTMIPAFQSAGATVYHGDCIEVMRSLPDASVDAVIAELARRHPASSATASS